MDVSGLLPISTGSFWNLQPREVDVLTYLNGAQMTFAISSPRVGFCMSRVFEIHVYCPTIFLLEETKILCRVSPIVHVCLHHNVGDPGKASTC
jgi:hypothetical protein